MEPWIACDNCSVWQHNVCVGISAFTEDIPANYLCEQCGPQNHKPLLDAKAKGVDLWVERRNAYERELAQKEAEEEAAKKKGKKGKGKRASDQRLETPKATNGKAKSPSAIDLKKDKKESTPKAGSAKRQSREDSHDHEPVKVSPSCLVVPLTVLILTQEPQSKKQKTSNVPSFAPSTPLPKSSPAPKPTTAPKPTPISKPAPAPKSPPTGLPVKIVELEASRGAVAKLISKGLVHAIQQAVKSNTYALSAGDTEASKAERLAIQLEDAIYKTHPDKPTYGKQARAIVANLKGNQELSSGLLSRTLSPAALAVMNSDDMASSEMKRSTAEMKARADKQSIMVNEDGPRVRRTHKGEELVESDNFAVANDSTMSTSRRRSMLDPNADMATRSRENSPGNEVELPESLEDYRLGSDRTNVDIKRPLNIETKTRQEPTRKASENNFDISKVFSSVQSPTTSQHARRQSTAQPAPTNQGAGDDPDIDRMLQDDEGNESPPYSPAEYPADPDTVWKGTVVMDSVAKFTASAKHVAGADLSKTMNWADLLHKELKIAGRISMEHANEYLCSLRYSPQTDVVVVEIIPHGELSGQGVNSLCNYFISKNRYGVLTNKGVGNIRDTYLIPVLPSPAKLPDFVINLEGHRLSENRPEPVIIVALVIRNDYVAPSQPTPTASTFDGVSDPRSPIITQPQRQMSMSGLGPAMSPINPQSGFPPAQPPPNHNLPIHLSQNDPQNGQAQRDGEANAYRILGDRAHDPTVAFLMPQAYHMREVEWNSIREILVTDPKARHDLQYLSQVLESKLASEGANGNGPDQY